MDERITMVHSLKESLGAIGNCKPAKVKVDYSFIDGSGQIKRYELPLNLLYDDWYGECTYCPCNEEPLLSLLLLCEDGTIIELSKEGLVEFGDMMDAFERKWSLKKGWLD